MYHRKITAKYLYLQVSVLTGWNEHAECLASKPVGGPSAEGDPRVKRKESEIGRPCSADEEQRSVSVL